jgi:glycine amidinotransferase
VRLIIDAAERRADYAAAKLDPNDPPTRTRRKDAQSMEDVVSSHNEWDPLEEIIVGVLDGLCIPPLDMASLAVTPRERIEKIGDAQIRQLLFMTGKSPAAMPQFDAARRELDEFVRVLEREGVKVRRPDPIDCTRPFATPDWVSQCGRGQSVPRDVMIVIGNEIIESPMSVRSRFFEILAYRTLIREYFRANAKWTAAPKPQMRDELYNYGYHRGSEYVLTEFEPVWDAADIARCGRDLFVQRSNVTNDAGIEWLRRHLGEAYRLHVLHSVDERAVHIDATLVPLAPGKLLISPERVPRDRIPEPFIKAGWEILEAQPGLTPGYRWMHLNCLSLDEKRIIVDKQDEVFIGQLKGWGFEPIPCAFRNFYPFGGSFHCATVDIRRRGNLQSYF